MKVKSRKKLKFLAVAALAGLLSGGCTTMEGPGLTGEDLFGVLLGTYSQTPASDQHALNRRTAAGLGAGVLYGVANAKRQAEIARAGKTEVIVYTGVR